MHIDFENIPTNGIKLHTALAGPANGEPVFLLHGFPDAWFGWEVQIRHLVDVGFRVIAPDQRGYNLSDKPAGISSYKMESLVEDIIGLADVLGYKRFHLAGHDFGAMIAWHLAMRFPARLKRLVIINVPHPVVMQAYLWTHLSQLAKSWHVFFFQLPWIPEHVAKTKDWRLLISALPDDLTEQERNRYREAWSRPNAMTSMINWYRSMLRQTGKPTALPKILVPTLILWGQQDPYLSYEMALRSVDFCEDSRLVTFEDATHWVMHDKPDEVSQLLIAHFESNEI